MFGSTLSREEIDLKSASLNTVKSNCNSKLIFTDPEDYKENKPFIIAYCNLKHIKQVVILYDLCDNHYDLEEFKSLINNKLRFKKYYERIS